MATKKKKKTNKLPFSKSTIIAARYESYIIAALLFFFVWCDKDVSSIVVLASLSWGGYRIVQNFYIWLCKHEHLMDKQIEFKKLGLDASKLEEEQLMLENQNFDSDMY